MMGEDAMMIRPVDEQGDILTVLSRSDLMTGVEAVGRLAEAALKLQQGEWWEDALAGSPVLDILRDDTFGEEKAQELEREIPRYLRELPGVASVEDTAVVREGGQLVFRCRLLTDSGEEVQVSESVSE